MLLNLLQLNLACLTWSWVVCYYNVYKTDIYHCLQVNILWYRINIKRHNYKNLILLQFNLACLMWVVCYYNVYMTDVSLCTGEHEVNVKRQTYKYMRLPQHNYKNLRLPELNLACFLWVVCYYNVYKTEVYHCVQVNMTWYNYDQCEESTYCDGNLSCIHRMMTKWNWIVHAYMYLTKLYVRTYAIYKHLLLFTFCKCFVDTFTLI